MKKRCYLAGPIEGLSFTEATSWREQAQMELSPEIECLSPMRGKNYLASLARIGQRDIDESYKQFPLSTHQGVMTRDFFDVKSCDMILAAVLRQEGRPSYGTVMELGWAYAFQKPVVLLTDDPVFREHPMLDMAVTYKARDWGEAIDLVKIVLNVKSILPTWVSL